MKHILFGSNVSTVKVAILIKSTALNKIKLDRYYIEPHTNLKAENFIAFDLAYDNPKKCSAKAAKAYIQELLPEIDNLGITTLMVCDTIYFKQLTKHKKTEPHNGYVCPCMIEKYEHLNIILCPNYQAVVYNPDIQDKIDRAVETVDKHLSGNYEEPGKDIIESAYIPDTVEEIRKTFEALHKYPELVCDIETKSLEFWNAGISTVAFAWNKHNGATFGIERRRGIPVPGPDFAPEFAWRSPDKALHIKRLLKEFIENYKGKLTFHNIGYDGKVLVYELWMKHLQDYAGMIEGIKAVTKNFDDTKLIAYFATNNAVQNVLNLKDLSAEFTGNYAEDTIDTTKIPITDLLIYNLKDCLATWYVKEKYEPIMITDGQQKYYEEEFKEYVVTLMQTELCGMPISPEKVQIAKKTLLSITDKCNHFFDNSKLIKTFHMGQLITKAENKTKMAAANAKTSRATKVYKVTDSVIAEDFNPNSDTQLRALLYDYLSYPEIDFTKGKQLSTGNKTIKKLIVHAKNKEHMQMFEYLLELADANIILNNFIKAFENAQQLPDGSWRLYGNFRLGGTQSLRISSNNPNLTNIPSGSTYAKLVKECFISVPGWVFLGSDFSALEDKTGALLTKDPQRLKIYTDGFCGHCLRTQYYWPDKMPEIDPNSVDSINSIKKLYPVERQLSKAPSFALQYAGTHITLMANCGFSEVEAKAIETNYHKLYKVSDQWVEDIIEKAKKTGYVPMAFGTRIKTPLLAKTVGKGRSVPYAAKAEARSAGNAATQSYCVLTLRAMNEFRKRVWNSPYIYDIMLSATIHDSIYALVRNDTKIVKWVNDNLIECMAWNELPELQHDVIKISSGLEIYWPSWANVIEIPNGATEEEIKSICAEAQKEN